MQTKEDRVVLCFKAQIKSGNKSAAYLETARTMRVSVREVKRIVQLRKQFAGQHVSTWGVMPKGWCRLDYIELPW